MNMYTSNDNVKNTLLTKHLRFTTTRVYILDKHSCSVIPNAKAKNKLQ